MIISGTYNLNKNALFRDNNVFPNPETELLCDTNIGAVVVNLPPISSIKVNTLQPFVDGFYIIVTDFRGNSNVNNIIVNATGGDTINGVSSSSILINTNGNSLTFNPINSKQWVAFSNNGGGGGGGGGDKNFVYTQILPANIWTVNHNLNKRCAVQVIDNTFKEVEAEILWVDNNTVTITMNNPSTGFVYCN